MSSDVPKIMAIPLCIEILKKYTDEDHTLTQEQINEKLKSEYGLIVDRKTLSRDLKLILDYYDEVHCHIYKRNGEEITEFDDDTGAKYSDFYYEHEFLKSELQALIYNVVFAKHIASNHKKDIVEKLESLGPFSVRRDGKHYINDVKGSSSEFGQLFMNLDDLEEAIDSHNIVKFKYSHYEEDKELHIDKRVWIVAPIGIAEKDNDYYLVGQVCGSEHESPENLLEDIRKRIDDYEKKSIFLDTFRIDQIRNIKIVDKKELSKTDKEILKNWSIQTIDLEWKTIQDYVNQNSSLCPGRKVKAKFKMENDREAISEAIDYFGKKNLRIKDSEFTVETNDRTLIEFAKKYAKEVEVIEPEYLREELTDIFKQAYEKMKKNS